MTPRSRSRRNEGGDFYAGEFFCERRRSREQHFEFRREVDARFADGFRGRPPFRGRGAGRSFRKFYGRPFRGRPWGPERRYPCAPRPGSENCAPVRLGSTDLRWRLGERPPAMHDDRHSFFPHQMFFSTPVVARPPFAEYEPPAPPPHGRGVPRCFRRTPKYPERRRSPTPHFRDPVQRRRERTPSPGRTQKSRRRSYENNTDLQTYDDVDWNDESSPEYQRYWDSFVFSKQTRPERTVESRIEVTSETSWETSIDRNLTLHEQIEKGKRKKHASHCSPEEYRGSRASKRRVFEKPSQVSADSDDNSSSSSDSSGSSSSSSSSSNTTSRSTSADKNINASSTDSDLRQRSQHVSPRRSSRYNAHEQTATMTDVSVHESSQNSSTTELQTPANDSTSNIPVLLSSTYGSTSDFSSSTSWFDSSYNLSNTTSNDSSVYTSEDSGNASMADISLERSDPRGHALDQLRKLTRWVLRSCISRYMPSVRPPQLSALQVGITRDADVSKWTECGVQHVLMVDREGSHMDAANRAHQRACETGNWCTVDWIYRDYVREVWPHTPVDVACSHLAMHAALGSSSKAELFAHNISCSLKEGSCLVMTVISATRLLSLLRKGRDGKVFEGENFRLRLHGHSARSTLPKFGVRFTLQIGSDRFEDYVVQLSVVEDIFAPHRLQLITRRSFMQLFDQSCSFNTCLEQLQQLQLVENNAPNREKLSPMMQDIAELFDVVIFRKISSSV